MTADLPLGRMKPGLFGLIPSAMYATLTPEPSKPSWAAVLAFGFCERTLRVCRASGSSLAVAGVVPQTAGSTAAGLDGSPGAAVASPVAAGPAAPPTVGRFTGDTGTGVSSTTDATAGS